MDKNPARAIQSLAGFIKRWSILEYLQKITIPTPFPVGPINIYLATGDELTLIDTGPKDQPTLDTLRAELYARGVAFKDIHRVVVTHAHVDHFGLAAQIVAESGAAVLSHSLNRWWLTDFGHEWGRRYDFYRDAFERSGAPLEYAEKVVAGMQRLADYADSIPANRFVPLEDGDTIMLGGNPWRVVYAPGHAHGLICLHDPVSRTLISSDHLLRDITSNPVMEPPERGETARSRALVDYIASMERTARLNVARALPAHGGPIDNVRALVEERIAFHRARLERIEQQLECCAQTPYEICNILFPKLKSYDIFLGLSEVIGHLDILEQEGHVRLDASDGLWRYIPTRER